MNISLGQRLNRRIEESEEHSISTLNDLVPAMIGELKMLAPSAGSWIDADEYLDFYVEKYHSGHIDSFLRDVIVGGADPKTWGYRDMILFVGERSQGASLTMSVDEVKAELADVEGERWARDPVNEAVAANRDAASGIPGVPGVLVRNVPYWAESPRETIYGAEAKEPIDYVPDEKFDIALRRWIAQRASWWAKRVDLASADVHQVAAAIGIDPQRVSADGAIAVTALIREARLPFDPATQVRGFVGPDEWYLP